MRNKPEDYDRVYDVRLDLQKKHHKLLSKHGWPGVGEGWLPIIDRLCTALQLDIDLNKTEQVEVMQIKEKFGGLRFYTGPATKEQHDLINKAEKEADATCDVCGEPGKLRHGNWMVTRCDAHA